MNRFFVDPSKIVDNKIIIDTKDEVGHIRKVLRLREGDMAEVSDGVEWEYIGKISYISEDEVELEIQDKNRHGSEPCNRYSIFQGVPKQGKMDAVIQKCTELGANEITPVFMSRTVISKKDSLKKKHDRFNQIARSAAEQCKRGIVPKVQESIDFDGMIEELLSFDVVIFPYENEKGATIKDALRTLPKKRDLTLAIVIGPEGGFSDEEARRLMMLLNCHCVSLGSRILRTETAAMATLAMCTYELEL